MAPVSVSMPRTSPDVDSRASLDSLDIRIDRIDRRPLSGRRSLGASAPSADEGSGGASAAAPRTATISM